MDILKQPIKIGPINLSSRLVMAPMETGKADNNRVSQALCDYYDEKSRGGYLGMVITEHCYVSPRSASGSMYPRSYGRKTNLLRHRLTFTKRRMWIL